MKAMKAGVSKAGKGIDSIIYEPSPASGERDAGGVSGKAAR